MLVIKHMGGIIYMKKSTIMAFSAIIITFLVLTSIGDVTKVYEKQERYNTPEEAIVNFIGYGNSYEKVKTKSGYYEMTPREFLESLSRRYRLFVDERGGRNINVQLPALTSYKISEIDFKDLENIKTNYNGSFDNIKSAYEKSFDKIPNYKNPKEVRAYKLDSECFYDSYIDKVFVKEDGTVDKSNYDEKSEKPQQLIDLYLIVVDEGEGYVVDYYDIQHK